jgi:hypothetical protein
MSGARPSRVVTRGLFDLGSHQLAVVDVEGAVALHIGVGGFPAGPLLLANIFATPDTADQLQAVVDCWRGVAWDG